MAHRKQFYLYLRHKKHGDYWYVCYLDPETGAQMSAKSIDCLKERLGILDFQSVKRKEDAAIIAQKALDSGFIHNDEASTSFVEYCRKFWNYDTSEYIAMRNHLKENSIGREYSYNMLKGFEKNIAPLLPSGLKLMNVTTPILDRVLRTLYERNLAKGTIQMLAYSFTLPLKEATRRGILKSNPADRLLFASKEERQRGVLTRSEFFALREALERNKAKMSSSYYLGILLAMTTGMRCSEIRALHMEDIVETSNPDYSMLLIRHSMAYFSGRKSTKSKYDRTVLVDHRLAEMLKANASESGVVLPSKSKGKEYLSSPSLRSAFYDMLKEIRIDEKERQKRNLTFHSLRHTFSTLCRDEAISQEDRMLVLGHKSKEVNDRYTHASMEALEHVYEFSAKLFDLGMKE